jgi:HlyD family secretion protein
LEVRVATARTARDYEALRLRHEEERLVRFLLQVDRCTIRAPHDGLLIYADKPGRPPRIMLGAPVWQRQKLFFLPDLSVLEVHVLLHETVVTRVRPGMPARVQPESSPQQILMGRVLSVSPLPASDQGPPRGNEVRYYVGRIGLDTVPQGLRPGMTAEVSIMTVQSEALGRSQNESELMTSPPFRLESPR